MFRNVLGRKECKVKSKDRGDDEDEWSTEDAVLAKIPLNFAKKMQNYRAVRGNKSKYVDNLIPKGLMPQLIVGKKNEVGRCVWPDGMTHATLHHQDLVSRRTSCSFPNEQYWPKRNEGFVNLRKVFAAPNRSLLRRLKARYKYELPSWMNDEDCWFVAIDYGQMQARIAGMLSKDRLYCTYLWDRNDLHMEWTKRLARAYPNRVGGKRFIKDIDSLKKFRIDVKNQWTFPLIFGATANSVSGYLDIPVAVLKPLISEFFDEMPGLKKWQTKTRRFYNEHGYVEGPAGWRRYGPLDHGKVINTPIQNGEAEIVLDAMTRLSEAAQDLNEWQFQARLEIHDELGFWIPKKTIDRDLEFIAGEMLQCEHFDWINVPLLIEISKGPNWFDQEDVAEIFSDDMGFLDRKACGF
jgi:DNA polymerase I-like protein with 3'-5' exonuclease and polymerase domains